MGNSQLTLILLSTLDFVLDIIDFLDNTHLDNLQSLDNIKKEEFALTCWQQYIGTAL